MVEKKDLKFAVLGAGHGGKAMAAHLAIKGFSVNLFNRTWDRIRPIALRGGIGLSGEIEGYGKLNLVTSNMEEVIKGVDVIMVVVPATGHRYMAEQSAPYLQDGQIVLLNPGRTGGALEFSKVLKDMEVAADVIISEAQTFIYASRSMGPADAKIFRIKNTVPVAALPATKTQKALESINKAYPQFIPADSVLQTSLDNMGTIFHPCLTILNSARIESTRGNFQYYIEGVTPTVAHILEVVDRERMTVAAALGVRATSAVEWLEMAYNATGSNLFEAIQSNPGYRGISAPRSLENRYLLEDVPASLVPIASLGKSFGVSTPTIDTFIHLASLLHRSDYWEVGRTVKTLGLEGLTVDEIQKLVHG